MSVCLQRNYASIRGQGHISQETLQGHKGQRQKARKERGKNNAQKAAPTPKSSASESAVATTLTTVGPRLTDVTSVAVRRPFAVRMFTQAIPRILRRGGPQQAITASASPPLLTAPPSEPATASSPTQSPVAIVLPEGRTLAKAFSRRSTANFSSTSDPSFTDRSSSTGLQQPRASDTTQASIVTTGTSTEAGSTSPETAAPDEAPLNAATEDEESADAPARSTGEQFSVDPGTLDTELHPASSSALSVSPSSLALSPAVQLGPKVQVDGGGRPSVSPDLLNKPTEVALRATASATLDDALSSPEVIPRRSVTDSEAQMACAPVACTGGGAPARPAVPDDNQASVFISDELPGAAASAETSPARSHESGSAAVQRLVCSAFAGVLQHENLSTAGSDSRPVCSSPHVCAESSSVYSPAASFDQSVDSTPPDRGVRVDVASAQPINSASPLQSRASSSRTPTGILLNEHLAQGSGTAMSAASESGTDVVSTAGTATEYPCEGPDGSPILQAHHEQAALLKLHMMGKKKKKFKAGSYVIGDDGSVTRGKRPPAR